MTRKVGTLVFTLLFLGTMFGSLFHMSMGMDMTGEMSGCPFMSQSEVICQMNLADHIKAWQSAFSAVVPLLTLLLSALVAAVLVLSIAPNLLLKYKFREPTLSRGLQHRTYSYSYRPFQELFSNGILHPKLYNPTLS